MTTILTECNELGKRLRVIRGTSYGEGEIGLASLADALGLPARTWRNYELGVTIPGGILLRFIVLTGTRPRWLMDGTGEPRSMAS